MKQTKTKKGPPRFYCLATGQSQRRGPDFKEAVTCRPRAKLARSVEKDQRAALFTSAVFWRFPMRQAGNISHSPNAKRRFSMTQTVTYQRETKSAPFQGKTIVLENLTPVLSQKVRDKRKKEIERCLFEVFSKYEDRRR